MRRFLLIVFASFASFAGHLRAQPANVQADLSTGALFRPAAATFISGNSLLTTTGNASGLTALNATQLTSGTVPDARFPATLPAASGTNLTALNASNLGSGTVPAARFPALTGEATTSAGAVSVTLTNSAVIGKVLTGYTSGAGTVAATDTILQAVQKLNGNDGNLQPLDAELTAIAGISSNGLFARTGAGTAAARTLTGTAAEITVTNGDGVAGNPTLSLPTALTFTGKTITGGTFASPTLTTPALGTPASGVVTNLTGTASININGTVGATTPTTGVFTGLTVNDNSTVGSSNTDTVTFNARVASDLNPSTDNTYDLGVTGHEWRNLNIDGTANIDSLVADTADINGGTIDGTAIGSGTASTGAFTTLSATGRATLSYLTVSTATPGGLGANIDVIDSIASNMRFFSVGADPSTNGSFQFYSQRSNDSNQVLAATISSTGVAVTGLLTATNGITSDFNNGTAQGINIRETTDASNANFVVFRRADTTAIGSITRVTTTNAVAYNTTSDARLKTNIRDFTAADAARIIDGLRPRWFDWKSGDLTESVEETVDTGKKDKDGKAITEKRQKNQKVKSAARISQHIADNKSIIGFIAQEEAAVDPALVRAGAVTVGDDDPTTISRQWARSDAALVPVLVAELKSLRARVAELEKDNASLDARMAAVEALLKK